MRGLSSQQHLFLFTCLISVGPPCTLTNTVSLGRRKKALLKPMPVTALTSARRLDTCRLRPPSPSHNASSQGREGLSRWSWCSPLLIPSWIIPRGSPHEFTQTHSCSFHMLVLIIFPCTVESTAESASDSISLCCSFC